MGIKGAIRKTYNKKKKQVKKRYTKKGGSLRLGQIAQDVMMMKRLVNTEKKSTTTTSGLITVGQVNGNSSGAACFFIQPALVRGTGANAFTGNSVKLVSAYLQFQIQQQTNNATDTSYIFEIWDVRGQPDSTPTITIENIFEASTFSAVIDSYSSRVQNEFNDYKLMKRFTVRFPNDNYSTTLAQLRTVQIPLKMNKHLRYNTDNSIANGQMAITIRSNSGNMSGTTASTLAGIPVSAINSGAEVRYALKWYYVDN